MNIEHDNWDYLIIWYDTRTWHSETILDMSSNKMSSNHMSSIHMSSNHTSSNHTSSNHMSIK